MPEVSLLLKAALSNVMKRPERSMVRRVEDTSEAGVAVVMLGW